MPTLKVRPLRKVTDLFLFNNGDRIYYILAPYDTSVFELDYVVADDIQKYDLDVGDHVIINGNEFEITFIESDELSLIRNYNLENFDGWLMTR